MKQTSLSAGAVPFKYTGTSFEYLILRAFKYWDFPKGMVEVGEDPWDAALREVKEETGLSQLTVPFGTVYLETEPYGKGKVARYYIVKVLDDAEVKLLPNPITGIIEHHEYRWVSYEEAQSILPLRVSRVLDWAHTTISAHS